MNITWLSVSEEKLSMKLCRLRINSTSWKEVKTRAVSSELLTSRELSGGVHRQVSPSCSVTHGSVQSETTGGSPHWKTSGGKILPFCPQRTFKSTRFVTAVLRQINRWRSVVLVSLISQCCIIKWGTFCMVQQKKKKKKKKKSAVFLKQLFLAVRNDGVRWMSSSVLP